MFNIYSNLVALLPLQALLVFTYGTCETQCFLHKATEVCSYLVHTASKHASEFCPATEGELLAISTESSPLTEK